MDSKYQISSYYLASHSLGQVVKKLAGSNLFGSGFPTLFRRYPVIKVLDDMAVSYTHLTLPTIYSV